MKLNTEELVAWSSCYDHAISAMLSRSVDRGVTRGHAVMISDLPDVEKALNSR